MSLTDILRALLERRIRGESTDLGGSDWDDVGLRCSTESCFSRCVWKVVVGLVKP